MWKYFVIWFSVYVCTKNVSHVCVCKTVCFARLRMSELYTQWNTNQCKHLNTYTNKLTHTPMSHIHIHTRREAHKDEYHFEDIHTDAYAQSKFFKYLNIIDDRDAKPKV